MQLLAWSIIATQVTRQSWSVLTVSERILAWLYLHNNSLDVALWVVLYTWDAWLRLSCAWAMQSPGLQRHLQHHHHHQQQQQQQQQIRAHPPEQSLDLQSDYSLVVRS